MNCLHNRSGTVLCGDSRATECVMIESPYEYISFPYIVYREIKTVPNVLSLFDLKSTVVFLYGQSTVCYHTAPILQSTALHVLIKVCRSEFM